MDSVSGCGVYNVVCMKSVIDNIVNPDNSVKVVIFLKIFFFSSSHCLRIFIAHIGYMSLI